MRWGSGNTVILDSSRELKNITGATIAHSEHQGVKITGTDNSANTSFTSMLIDHNASGSTALTADRSHIALQIDMDSSATGGDTSNEHRLYGIHNNVKATGDSDLVYGIYSIAEAEQTAGQVSQLYGLFAQATTDAIAGTISNSYGVYGYNSLTASSGTTISNGYALYGKALVGASQDSNISTVHGLYAEVEIDASGAGTTVNTVYGVRSEIDNDAGSADTTITNGYLFYGNYAGDLPTSRYGVYIADNVRNYFAGNITTGDGSTGTAAYGFNGDANTGMYSPANHELGFLANGTQRLKVNADGITVTGEVRVASNSNDTSNSMGGQTPKLYVNGYTSLGGLRIQGTDGAKTIYKADGDLSIKIGTAHSIKFGVSGGVNLSITSSGHTNIGSGKKLQVNGTTVIDSSRNLTNIAAITASGEFKSTSTSSNAVKTRFISGAASGSTSNGPLYINYGKTDGVNVFQATSGNPNLLIYGNDNGTQRYGSLSVGTDGSFNVSASDTYLILNAASYIQSNKGHNFLSTLMMSGTTILTSARALQNVSVDDGVDAARDRTNIGSTDANNLTKVGFYGNSNESSNQPFDNNAGTIVHMRGRDGNYKSQLFSYSASGELWIRGKHGGSASWSSWSKVFHDGYHPTADKWTTATTISLTGHVTGSVSVDASANPSISTSIAAPADVGSNWRDVVAWSGSALVKDSAVEIHGSGYLRAVHINITHGQSTRNSDTIFYSSTDNYVRRNTAAGFRSSLDVYSKSEVDSAISANSNADTVDNLHASSFIRADADDNVGAHTEWQDNYQVRLGNGADFRMHHNGSHHYFRNYNHTYGNMYWQGEDSNGTNRALVYMITQTSAPYVQLFHVGNEKLRTVSAGINVYGDLTATGNVTAYSDIRKKTNIQPLEGGLDIVKALEPKRFDWIDSGEGSLGFIAQEVEEYLPELVETKVDDIVEIDEEQNPVVVGEEEVKSLDYGKMVSVLWAAVKEQSAQIETLNKRIEELENGNH